METYVDAQMYPSTHGKIYDSSLHIKANVQGSDIYNVDRASNFQKGSIVGANFNE